MQEGDTSEYEELRFPNWQRMSFFSRGSRRTSRTFQEPGCFGPVVGVTCPERSTRRTYFLQLPFLSSCFHSSFRVFRCDLASEGLAALMKPFASRWRSTPGTSPGVFRLSRHTARFIQKAAETFPARRERNEKRGKILPLRVS